MRKLYCFCALWIAAINKIRGIALQGALKNIAWLQTFQYTNAYIQL